MISTMGISAGVSPQMVDQLFRKADTNGDGHVSPTEFHAFMTNALQTPTGKSAVMALAQHVPATPANLQQIAHTLGSAVGHLEADGQTFVLNGSGDAIGIRNLGNGPVWQYFPASTGVAR